MVNIRSDDDLEPDELLGQFSSRDAEKVCCPARTQWSVCRGNTLHAGCIGLVEGQPSSESMRHTVSRSC